MTTWGTGGTRLGPNSTASYGNVQGSQGTAAEFVSINPVLPLGYLGYETDTRKLKIGDGSSDWNTLPYWHDIIPYASCYGNEIGWSQATAVQNTWYPISDSDMTDGSLIQAAHDGSGKITVATSGKYLVNWSIAVDISNNNDHVQVGIIVDGAANAQGLNHAEATKANDHKALSGTAILALTAGQAVQIGLRTTDANTPTLGVDHLNITLVWLGV
jgi:hypothetical protein